MDLETGYFFKTRHHLKAPESPEFILCGLMKPKKMDSVSSARCSAKAEGIIKIKPRRLVNGARMNSVSIQSDAA